MAEWERSPAAKADNPILIPRTYLHGRNTKLTPHRTPFVCYDTNAHK